MVAPIISPTVARLSSAIERACNHKGLRHRLIKVLNMDIGGANPNDFTLPRKYSVKSRRSTHWLINVTLVLSEPCAALNYEAA